MTKRRHTLRIIADHDGRYALLGWVDVDNLTGEVKYATTYGDIDIWRHSHHAGGVVTHHPTPAPDVLDQLCEAEYPPEESADAFRLTISKPPLAMAKWNYRPKVKHRNMIVPASQLLQFDVWAIRAGRDDLVREKVTLYPVVMQHELLDGCDPCVLAIAWTIPQDFWDESRPITSTV